MHSKRYESTEVDRRTWLHVPSGTPWSTSSDTHQILHASLQNFIYMERSAYHNFFSKEQTVNILIILHMHLRRSRRLWMILTYQRQFLDVMQSEFVLLWSEWNVPPVELVFSAWPISGILQPTFFARNDCLFVKQLFYEYQNEQQHNKCWNQLPPRESLSCVRLW